MARIEPLSIDNAPEDSKPIMEGLKAKIGMVPNIFATLAHSPAALNTLVSMSGALAEGLIDPKSREALALRIGQSHGCQYCTAAHTAMAQMAGASMEETIDFRQGKSDDAKTQALLMLTDAILESRGAISDEQLKAARDAGLSDGEIVETVAIFAVNCFTNTFNSIAQTDLDFPAAPAIE